MVVLPECQEEVSVVAVSKAPPLDGESVGSLKDVLSGAVCSPSPSAMKCVVITSRSSIFFQTHLKPRRSSDSFILLAWIMENIRLRPLPPASAFTCPSVRVVIVFTDSKYSPVLPALSLTLHVTQ